MDVVTGSDVLHRPRVSASLHSKRVERKRGLIIIGRRGGGGGEEEKKERERERERGRERERERERERDSDGKSTLLRSINIRLASYGQLTPLKRTLGHSLA